MTGLERCPAALRERFGICGVLGAGGMGLVLRGRLPGTGKPCAVKILLRAAEPEAVARFLREARAMARLRHPNLCEVYDSGELDGSPWLAMELVEGEDLKQALAREGPVPLGSFRDLILQVGGALEVVHAARVVHRDLKPANLMRDPQGRVVLMDFGLARGVDETRITATGHIVGTPLYLAPEVLLGSPPTPAADWYALGVTLHELVLNRRPFEFSALCGTLQDPQQPRLPALSIPHELEVHGAGRVLRALLAMDPAARPGSVEELLRLLDGSSEPLAASPSGSTTRARVSPARIPGGAPELLLRAPTRSIRLARLAPLLLLLSLLLWWLAPTPPRAHTGPSSPSPAATRPPTDAPDPLRPICSDLGLTEVDPPTLTLEAALESSDPALAGEVRTRLRALPDHPWARWRILQGLGGEENLARSEQVVVATPLDDFWEGRLRVEALGFRLLYAGPESEHPEPERLARLREDIATLERLLRDDPRPLARLVRVELWNLLARRLHRRPDWNMAALEYAHALTLDLLAEADRLPLDLRTRYWVILTKNLAWLGEGEHARTAWERSLPAALEPLASARTREHVERLVEETLRSQELSTDLLTAGFVHLHHDPTWLPFPEGYPGSCPSGSPAPRLVVPTPAGRAPVVLEDLAGDPRRALEDGASRALGELRGLTATPTWVRRHLVPEGRSPDPVLVEASLAWPALVVEAAATLEARGDPAAALELLRRGVHARRSRRPHHPARRAWFRGPPARLLVELVRQESTAGDRRQARREAGRTLGLLADLPGPWCLDEVEMAAGLWLALREGHPGRSRALDQEVLRLGLRALEARAVLGRSGLLGERLDVRDLEGIVDDLEAGGPGETDVPDLPEPGLALPEASLPPAPGTPRERLAALRR